MLSFFATLSDLRPLIALVTSDTTLSFILAVFLQSLLADLVSSTLEKPSGHGFSNFISVPALLYYIFLYEPWPRSVMLDAPEASKNDTLSDIVEMDILAPLVVVLVLPFVQSTSADAHPNRWVVWPLWCCTCHYLFFFPWALNTSESLPLPWIVMIYVLGICFLAFRYCKRHFKGEQLLWMGVMAAIPVSSHFLARHLGASLQHAISIPGPWSSSFGYLLVATSQHGLAAVAA